MQKCWYVVVRTRCTLETSMVRQQTNEKAAFASLKGDTDRKPQPKASRIELISNDTW